MNTSHTVELNSNFRQIWTVEKAEVERVREEKGRRKKIEKRERELEERRCMCAKR